MTKIGFNFYTLVTDLLFAKRVSEKLTNDTKLISNSCASAWSLSKSLPHIKFVYIDWQSLTCSLTQLMSLVICLSRKKCTTYQ